MRVKRLLLMSCFETLNMFALSVIVVLSLFGILFYASLFPNIVALLMMSYYLTWFCFLFFTIVIMLRWLSARMKSFFSGGNFTSHRLIRRFEEEHFEVQEE